MSTIINSPDFEKFYNKALRFLSFRPRSEKEIRDYLKKSCRSGFARKEIDPLIIDKIIFKLKEQKFLNDEEFAKWWVESRTSFKPRAWRLMKLELKRKGISNEIIDQISNLKNQKLNDRELVRKLIEKKIQKYKGLTREKIYQKLGGFLARKGFDYEIIKQSIDEYFRK